MTVHPVNGAVMEKDIFDVTTRKGIFLLRKKTLLPDRERVFACMRPVPGSSLTGDLEEEYQAVLPGFLRCADPGAAVCFTKTGPADADGCLPEGSSTALAIAGVGGRLAEFCGRFFREEAYVRGLLADTMANVLLFTLTSELDAWVSEQAAAAGTGAARILEIPGALPVTWQKTVWEKTKAEELLGIHWRESGVLEPEKSLTRVYLLEEGSCGKLPVHDCSVCGRKECMYREKSQM